MWLSSSSVGRKFIMAITGAVLVLFVTFHCLMNAVAILWPVAYNSVCMFLGANWYALVASAGLALFIVVHIIYAVMLTVQNRRARGHERYAINKRPASVEWSSQNMFVLGIVILAFLVVHLIQFWAKMQLVEICGCETIIPATAGTLFLQEAFAQPWTIVVYIIGFIALWFHLNHGFWSMFQSVGWDSTVWIPRLKCIAKWWVGIVTVLFIAEAVVFTINANKDFYKTDEDLRAQYISMVGSEYIDDLGPDAENIAMQMMNTPDADRNMQIDQLNQQIQNPEIASMMLADPKQKKYFEFLNGMNKFINYLNGYTPEAPKQEAQPAMGQPQGQEVIVEQEEMTQEVAPAEAQPEQPADAEQPAEATQPAANN